MTTPDQIWVYSIMRNEAQMVGWWVKHYRQFADRIIVYEDKHSDATHELLRSAGVETRMMPFAGIDDQKFVALAGSVYKEARGKAAFVIWVDADEFIVWPGPMRDYLIGLHAAGIQLPHVMGWAMVAESFQAAECFPGSMQIYDVYQFGFPDDAYGKPVVVDPQLEIEWAPGRHSIQVLESPPVLRGSVPALALLHYRWMGVDYFRARNCTNWGRIHPDSRAQGYGETTGPHWESSEKSHSIQWYQANAQSTVNVVGNLRELATQKIASHEPMSVGEPYATDC